MKALPFIVVLLSQAGMAQDFGAQVKRIQANGDQIDAQMQQMGFLISARGRSLGTGEEKPTRRRLYQVHSENTALRSEAGRTLSAQTLNRLVVGPEGSPAILTLEDGQGLFSGLRVLGTAKQGSTEGRLYIDFERLVFRTGKVIPIKGVALDDAGAFGLKAQVLSSKALMVAGSIASSFISGYAASQQTQQTNAFGFSQPQTGSRNGVLQGVAQTAADQSKRLIDDSTKEKPVLVVDPKTKVTLYLDEEVKF